MPVRMTGMPPYSLACEIALGLFFWSKGRDYQREREWFGRRLRTGPRAAQSRRPMLPRLVVGLDVDVHVRVVIIVVRDDLLFGLDPALLDRCRWLHDSALLDDGGAQLD